MCKIKNPMKIFEKFLENFIFRYTRAQDAHDAEIRIRKAPKPSEYNFQEVAHIFRIFIPGFLVFFIDFSVPM